MRKMFATIRTKRSRNTNVYPELNDRNSARNEPPDTSAIVIPRSRPTLEWQLEKKAPGHAGGLSRFQFVVSSHHEGDECWRRF